MTVLGLLAVTPGLASHGGDHQDGISIYGDHMKNPDEAAKCSLVDFVFEDGHTNKFYVCEPLLTNDLTPSLIPELHVKELHVSCSDSFLDTDGDGFGNFQKGDPAAADGSGRIHEVASWRVVKYEDKNATTGDKNEPQISQREIKEDCGQTFTSTRDIVCTTSTQTVNSGGEVDYTFNAVENSNPASGVQVLFAITAGDGTITSANPATTDGNGDATVTVRGNSPGTVTIQGVFDADGDGTADSTEAAANCTLEVNDTHDIVCQTGTQTVDIGDQATYTFRATQNGSAVGGATVIASVPSGDATVISVGGTAGDTGTTASNGTVAVVVEGTSVSNGTVDVRASYDVDGSGTVDSGEPTDNCLLRVENPPVSASVDKTNDANENGTFTDDEIATDGPGQDVQFRVVVQNTSNDPIVIDSLRDEFPDGAANATSIDLSNDNHNRIVANDCDDLIGDVLAPQGQAGDDATCTFTLSGYAPQVLDSPLDDRVFLQVHEEGDPSNTATDDDDSRVRTEGEITAVVDKTNDADRDGTFTDDETAPDGPGQDVEFQVRIVNNSNVAVIIDRLRDSFPAGSGSPTTIDLLSANPAGLVSDSNTCAALAGEELARAGDPGDSATCTFTASDYAPPLSDNQLDNRVLLEVHQKGDDTKRDSDEDDSTVRTEGDITAVVDKTNDADGDGSFGDDELADRGPGQDVRFRLQVSNTSPNAAVVIDELRDEFPDGARSRQTIDLLDDDAPGLIDNTCDDLRNRRLAPAGSTGDRVDCEFVVADYAPAFADSPLDNRVFLEVHMDGDTSRRDADNDDSRVRTDQDEVTAEVDKTNDADGNQAFTDDETASSPGQDVTFRVEVQNTSSVNVVISSLTDEFPDGAADATSIDLATDDDRLVDNTCRQLIGVVLTPTGTQGDDAACTFTVADYAAPVADSPLDNRVFLEVHEEGDESNTGTDDDDSRVRTEGEIGVVVDKTNDADLNDDFGDNELADDGEGQDVTFRVLVENVSAVAVVIESLTDEFPAGASDARVINLLDPNAPGLVDNTCVDLADTLLAPDGAFGDSATCTFTVEDYAPTAADSPLVNRVDVEVRDEDDTQRASDDDESRVRSEEVTGVEPGVERPPPPAPEPPPVLPRTGSESIGLGATGTSFILLGMMLVAAAAMLDRRGQLVVVGGDGRAVTFGEFLDKQIRWARDDFRRYRQSRTTLWGRAATQLRWAQHDIRGWMNG